MRILILGVHAEMVRDGIRSLGLGHEVWSCGPNDPTSPGLHHKDLLGAIVGAGLMLDGWAPVRFSAECDPDGDGWCQIVDGDPGECPCFGPTQDGIEYMERDGVLFGRPIDHPGWDMILIAQ